MLALGTNVHIAGGQTPYLCTAAKTVSVFDHVLGGGVWSSISPSNPPAQRKRGSATSQRSEFP
jgi:hypothetical protein